MDLSVVKLIPLNLFRARCWGIREQQPAIGYDAGSIFPQNLDPVSFICIPGHLSQALRPVVIVLKSPDGFLCPPSG